MKPNATFPRYTRFFAWVLPALLSACATSSQLLVGTLETSGQNVWVNGKRAATEMEIYSGDEVSTGPESEAYVYFSSGGFIHIDENTDPIFDWLKEGTCIICKIGRILIDAKRVCAKTPQGWFTANSRISIDVTGDITTLIVVEGEVKLEGPDPRVVRSNEQLTVSQSGVEVRHLLKEELVAAIEWHTGVKAASVPVTQPVEPVAKVEPPPAPTEMVRLEDVFFGFDDDTIRSDQEARLEKIADLLNNNPTIRVLIEGRSDPRGPVEYNKVLALRRAEAVQGFLVKRGIVSGRIETISRVGDGSLSSCPDETCWAQDRRAQFTIISK